MFSSRSSTLSFSDYTEPDNSKWTKKLKSHLPFASSSKSSFAHKPMVEDEDGDDEGKVNI